MAKEHKGPSVDPLHGDLRAEPGSREWALGVRASLWGKERDLGAGVKDVAMRLDRLLVTEGWKHLFRSDGTPFETFEEYLSYRTPYGMGVPLDMMRHYLSLTHEGRTLRERLAVKGHPTHRVKLTDINRDGGTQVREGMKAATVEEYAAAIADGAAFPPVVVFFDGDKHWLADGFHRVAAHEAAGVEDVLAEVRQGTREDALWFALSANKRHGLPMSPEDKRKAVRLLLGVEKWAGMSNAAIAKELGISDHTVADVKREMGHPTSQSARLEGKTEGTDGKYRSAPGDASDLVRSALGDPGFAKMSNAAIAKQLKVSPSTVAKVRKLMASAPTEDTAQPSKPAPPTRHPALVAIDNAADLDALGRALTAANADTSLTDKEEVGAAYQKRSAALREQSAVTPAAPAPVSTQAAPSQPKEAAAPAKQGSLFEEAPAAEVAPSRQELWAKTLPVFLRLSPADQIEWWAVIHDLMDDKDAEWWTASLPTVSE